LRKSSKILSSTKLKWLDKVSELEILMISMPTKIPILMKKKLKNLIVRAAKRKLLTKL
jgi:hypothetical protein